MGTRVSGTGESVPGPAAERSPTGPGSTLVPSRVVILWPCVATFQNGAVRTSVKVWSTPDRCDVYAWNVATRRVELLAHSDGPAREIEGFQFEVDVDDGTMVSVRIDSTDCGCSHPLKWFNPLRASVTPG